MIARLQALADKNIRKYDLLSEGGVLMKPFAIKASIPDVVARQPHRLLAHRAAGLSRQAAAVQQPVPGRRGHPGLAVPRRIGNYEAPGGT